MDSGADRRSEQAILMAGLDHIDQGISVFDQHLKLVFCNRRYLDLLDYPDHLGATGTPFEAYVRTNAERGEYGPGSVEAQVTKRVAEASSFIAAYHEQTRSDGTVLAIHSVPLPEGGFITVYSDITEQQQAEELIRERNEELEARVQLRTRELQEANQRLRDLVRSEHDIAEALKQSEARLRLITDAVPAGIAYIDAEQRYQFANQRIAKAFGLTKEKIIGKSVREVLGDALFDRLIPYLNFGQKGEEVTFEYTQQLASDREAQIRTNVIPALKQDKMVQGYYVLSLDVSDQKKAEAALAHAQKMEAVAELSGGLAHDFNNLLTVVLGNLSHLRDRCTAESEEAELLDPAIAASRRGAKLIRRLLTFSRQEQLEPESVDVPALIDSLVPMLHSTLPESIAISSSAVARGLLAFVDPHQLENALLNLCFNARDAMTEGGSIKISAAMERIAENSHPGLDLPDGDYVSISVADNGTGIEAAALERVFEPFFSMKAPGLGSGLGLSMVYGFAKQSGGAVSIDSQVGSGTEVRLLLPCAEEATRATKGEVAPFSSQAGDGALVLLVDDDIDVRKVVRRQLMDLAMPTIEASNADEALKLLDTVEEISVLLSDVVMPGKMNGFELARCAVARRPDIRVLLMSAYTERLSTEQEDLQLEILRKPFDNDELMRAIGSPAP